MRTVYACVFEVSVSVGETAAQAFQRLAALAVEWVEEFYRLDGQTAFAIAFDGVSRSPLPQHTFQANQEQTGGVCELVTFDWNYPDRQDVGLRWVTALQLARNGKRLEVSLAVRILSSQPIIKPLNYTMERPVLIDRILTGFACFVGKTPIPLQPRQLSGIDVKHFVEETLCAPDRWLPVVLISPVAGAANYLVDPAELQRQLLGHAQVVALADIQAGHELTHCLGNKVLSCYLGAVRVYWPGFNLAARPTDHPLYLAESIRSRADNKQPLGLHLFRMILGVSGFRCSNAPTAGLVRSLLDQEKQARWQHLLANSKTADETQEILRELERAWDEAKQLRQEREEARAQVGELTRELESHQAAWASYPHGPGKPAAAGEPAGAAPASVQQAVQRAQSDFAATLVFLPTALESASSSPYQWPERVYALFQALDELTRRWQQSGSLGASWYQALKPKGFDYKEFISPTAKGKFGHQYTFTFDAQAQLFENHVTLGAKSANTCISIHWLRHEKSKRLVIAWCGRHLDNTQS